MPHARTHRGNGAPQRRNGADCTAAPQTGKRRRPITRRFHAAGASPDTHFFSHSACSALAADDMHRAANVRVGSARRVVMKDMTAIQA